MKGLSHHDGPKGNCRLTHESTEHFGIFQLIGLDLQPTSLLVWFPLTAFIYIVSSYSRN